MPNITQFISNLIGNDYVATVLMSIVPLIELKGGIIFARATMGLGLAFLLAYVGSTIVFFPIYWLLVPILNALKRIKGFNGFATKVENYFKQKAEDTLKKRKEKNKSSKLSETFIKQLGVFIFVAIPLPMTGVWTGTAIAVFLGLKFREAILPVVVGNMVAGGLICGLAEFCVAVLDISYLDYILYALFILAIIILALTIVKVSLSKPKTATQPDGANCGESAQETATENNGTEAVCDNDQTVKEDAVEDCANSEVEEDKSKNQGE